MKKLFLPAVLAATGCAGSAKLTESQEYFMGRAVAALAIEKDSLYHDAALEEYLALVGLTVAFESDRPETYKGYTFGILNKEEINAFSAPSGFVLLTKGAIKAMQNEDELAGVLAHEIAHVNLRHPEVAAQRASDQTGLSNFAQTLTSLAGTVLGLAGKQQLAETAKDAAPVFGQTAAQLHGQFSNMYSRDEEFLADARAVEFLTREGVRYDPNAFKAFISRLPRSGGAWGTHPELEGRVQAIDKEIQKRSARGAVDAARTERFKAMTAGLRGQ